MPRTTVPIYRDDDFEKIADCRRKLENAKAEARIIEATTRAGDGDPEAVEDARRLYQEALSEAAERAEMWELESIGNVEFRALLKAHPPRMVTVKTTNADGVESESEQVDPEDALFGVNTETFGRALVEFVDDDDDDIRTVVEPVFENDRERRRRLKRLSEGELNTLWVKAFSLNRAMVRDPKAEAL